jgi:acyl dehydratase
MTAIAAALVAGQSLPPVECAEISRTTLAKFAAASGDFNPMHIDIDVARGAGMDDVFAHGMLSMAYLGRALVHWVPQSSVLGLSTRFVSITPVHARPTCTGRVVEVNLGVAVIELTTTLADGTVTLRGRAEVAVTPEGRNT